MLADIGICRAHPTPRFRDVKLSKNLKNSVLGESHPFTSLAGLDRSAGNSRRDKVLKERPKFATIRELSAIHIIDPPHAHTTPG